MIVDPGGSNVCLDAAPVADEMGRLFHRLNNQLGIALANAEMLEDEADPHRRHQATRVVSSLVEAMRTSRAIRFLTETI